MLIKYQNITSATIDVFEKEPKDAVEHIKDYTKRHKSFLYLGGEPSNPNEITEQQLIEASSVVLHHNILGG